MSAPLSPQQALAAQARVAARVDRDRRRASSAAMPLALFGVCSLIASGIASGGHWTALGIFWSIAGPAGGALIGWWYRRQDLRLRFDRPPTVVLVTTSVMIVGGALVLGWAGAGNATFFAVGCGYVIFAAASDNANVLRVAIAIIALTWLAQVDAWTAATGLTGAGRSGVLSAAVGLAQLAGAAAETMRTTRRDARA